MVIKNYVKISKITVKVDYKLIWVRNKNIVFYSKYLFIYLFLVCNFQSASL